MGKIDSGEIKKDVINSADDEILEEILFFMIWKRVYLQKKSRMKKKKEF